MSSFFLEAIDRTLASGLVHAHIRYRVSPTDGQLAVGLPVGQLLTDMCGIFEPGEYACLCCGELLFDAQTKFESGTGWPSFTQPATEEAIAYHVDRSMGMVRVETTCNVCDAHLGHVFPDGPAPSGLRYCMNAVALKKVTELA